MSNKWVVAYIENYSFVGETSLGSQHHPNKYAKFSFGLS